MDDLKIAVLAALKWIKENGPIKTEFGICSNVQEVVNESSKSGYKVRLGDIICTLSDYWEKWPKYSGDSDFPIASPNKDMTPSDCYDYCDSRIFEDGRWKYSPDSARWKGEIGRLRHELVCFLVEEIAK
jgi:hypothetical protein